MNREVEAHRGTENLHLFAVRLTLQAGRNQVTAETYMFHLKAAGSKAGILGRGLPTRELNVFIVEASGSVLVTQVTHTQDSIMTEHPQKVWRGKPAPLPPYLSSSHSRGVLSQL